MKKIYSKFNILEIEGDITNLTEIERDMLDVNNSTRQKSKDELNFFSYKESLLKVVKYLVDNSKIVFSLKKVIKKDSEEIFLLQGTYSLNEIYPIIGKHCVYYSKIFLLPLENSIPLFYSIYKDKFNYYYI